MAPTSDAAALEAIRAAARPLAGAREDYDGLLELVGDASFVLLGEATHGTHEFYRARAEITKRLIEEKGFAAVAAEADWPEAYRVNRYIRGLVQDGGDATAEEALRDFQRFPQWMWRNADVLDFVGWLRAYNEAVPASARVGFYGLDLYSLYGSIDAVIAFLDRVDPEASRRARRRYACFELFEKDVQAYGYAAGRGLAESCEDEVVEQLLELQRQGSDYARRDGLLAEDEFFYAKQNARVAKNAEAYYREMFRGRDSSWNLRDSHMAETLTALAHYLGRGGREPKIAVWAHNSHLGDARATQATLRGEVNLGQLVRERHGRRAVLVGFTTDTGTVTAASDWGEAAERKRVQPALPDSYEALFHETGLTRFFLPPRDGGAAADALRPHRLERFIGVIYRPDTERQSHYQHVILRQQFDAVFHFDHTRALEPLERTPHWEADEPREVPQTFPSAA
jgi:erythromycin esterase-like protein